jgi:pimeloyl-ACP methyl ester carboxylesterase
MRFGFLSCPSSGASMSSVAQRFCSPSHSPVSIIAIAALLFLLVGAGPMPVAAQPDVPRFEPGDCHFEVQPEHGDVSCGDLVVYEHRDDPAEGTLRLAVSILESTSDDPAPDPLVYLMGGPGGATLERMPWRATHPFWNQYRATRDIIFFDQRGTGLSDPTFCPHLNRTLYTDGLRGFSTEALLQRRVAGVRACREEMLSQGVDLSQYNSAATAHDLDDLRQSLGIPEWNLFGISYGTRVGLAALREAPDGIRSVILDSVTPVQAGYWNDDLSRFAGALRRVFDQCTGDLDCRETFPTLEQDIYALFAELEKEPLVVAMEDTSRFPDRRIVVDGTVMAQGIFQGLYSHHFVPFLPMVVRELRAGNTDLLAAMGDMLVLPPDAISRGQYYSVECYEVAPLISRSQVAAERAAHPDLAPMLDWWDHPAVCEEWHPYRAEAAQLKPVQSDVPALVVAGEFDPITPPAYARLAAETLSNHTLLEVRSRGHTVIPTTACTRDLMERFLDNPAMPLDTRCVDGVPPIRFVTDVHVKSGIYKTVQRFASGSNTATVAGLGGLGVVLLSGLFGWPVGYLVRRVRRRPSLTTRSQQLARWTAGLAAVLSVGFVAGLGVVVATSAAENPFLLMIGVPAGAGWLFVLPWIAGLFALGALAAAVQAWRAGWWSATHRLHFTLVAIASATLLILAAQWGLV